MIEFVGKLENFERDIAVVCKRLDIPFPDPIPHENRSNSRDYREFYDDQSREIIAHWFREDLEQFDYDFDGPK